MIISDRFVGAPGTSRGLDHYNGRVIWNRSFTDHESGMPFKEDQVIYEKALKTGDDEWGLEERLIIYPGLATDLIKEVKNASTLLKR